MVPFRPPCVPCRACARVRADCLGRFGLRLRGCGVTGLPYLYISPKIQQIALSGFSLFEANFLLNSTEFLIIFFGRRWRPLSAARPPPAHRTVDERCLQVVPRERGVEDLAELGPHVPAILGKCCSKKICLG